MFSSYCFRKWTYIWYDLFYEAHNYPVLELLWILAQHHRFLISGKVTCDCNGKECQEESPMQCPEMFCKILCSMTGKGEAEHHFIFFGLSSLMLLGLMYLFVYSMYLFSQNKGCNLKHLVLQR